MLVSSRFVTLFICILLVSNASCKDHESQKGSKTTKLSLPIKGIKQGVKAAVNSESSFPITIKFLTGRNVILEVKPSTTISMVKAMMQEMQGIPIIQQRYAFNGKGLEDGRSLAADYNIQRNSIVRIVLCSKACRSPTRG